MRSGQKVDLLPYEKNASYRLFGMFATRQRGTSGQKIRPNVQSRR